MIVSVVAGVITAAHFPPAPRAAAAQSVRQSFMTGLHAGSFVAAATTFAAALVALAFLPARARGRAQLSVSDELEESLSRTAGAHSPARQVAASQR